MRRVAVIVFSLLAIARSPEIVWGYVLCRSTTIGATVCVPLEDGAVKKRGMWIELRG